MGIDAGIFAKNTKKYFWFDRLSNIDAYWDLSDEHFIICNLVRTRLMNKENSLTTSEIIYFLKANVEAWEAREESQRYHANWVQNIIQFVKQHSDDHFFIAADNDDAYSLIGEMNGVRGGIWIGDYMEWTV